MFCSTSMNFLKQWMQKSNVPSIKYGYKCIASSAKTVVSETKNGNIVETIQVANHLKPLMNCPVDEILSNVDVKLTTPNESVTFLKALRMHKQFKNVSPEKFKTDSRFHILCNVFQSSCDSLDVSLLISGLRSLLEVGMPADSRCVVDAEKQIIMNCHKFSSFNLIRCLYFHHKFIKSDLQKEVVTLLREEFLKQLAEVSTSAEVLLLCQILHLFSEINQKKVELKIVELVPTLTIHEMCKVIMLLAQKSCRNIVILNAVVFNIGQKQELPNVKEIVDVFYAFKKLNYTDIKLFSYLLNTVVNEMSTITQPSLISGLLTTCGHLKIKHTELLDACTEWMKTNFNQCRTREFIAFILTSANLNYCTFKTRNLLERIIPSLELKHLESSNIFLDIVWSLAILNNLPKKMLIDVLSPKYYKPLIDNTNIQPQTTAKLKLMNLKGILKVWYPEHVFGCDLYLEPIKLKESDEIENSRKHIINVLSNFVPKDKCLCTNQSNDTGIFIDAEFIMDHNIRPLALTEFGLIATSTSKIRPLPKGAKRFALLTLFHKDYTLKTKSLTGVNVLAIKLLTHLGYSVLQIEYDEFLKNKTEVQKAKYLMQKVKVLMQNPEKNL